MVAVATLEKTRDQIITENLKLVYSVSKSFGYKASALNISMEDVHQIGIEGLIKAVDKFDPEKGFQFSTYAVPLIKGQILRHFRDADNGPKIGRRIKDITSKISSMPHWWTLKEEDIANYWDVDFEIVKEALKTMKLNSVSIDQPVYDDEGSSTTIADILSDTTDETVSNVKEFINNLDDRNKQIVTMTLRGETQKAIGEMIGVGQVQVSRIIQNQIAPLLKNYMEGEPMSQGDLKRAKELLETTNLTVKQIADETGCNVGTLRTYKHQSLNEKRKPTTSKKETYSEESELTKLKEKLSLLIEERNLLADENRELKRNLTQNEQAVDMLENLKTKNAELISGREKLIQEIADLKQIPTPLEHDPTEEILAQAELNLYKNAWKEQVLKTMEV